MGLQCNIVLSQGIVAKEDPIEKHEKKMKKWLDRPFHNVIQG